MRKTLVTIVMILLGAQLAIAESTINLGTVSVDADTASQTVDINISGGDTIEGMNFYFQIGGGSSGPQITAVTLADASTIWGADAYVTELGGSDSRTLYYSVITNEGTGGVTATGKIATITLDTTGIPVGDYNMTMTVSGFPSEVLDGGGSPMSLTLNDGTLSEIKATPTITAWPTASDIVDGQSLAESTLTGGTASVPGSFAFTTPATTPPAGTAAQNVTFTPTDTANYNTVAGTAEVTVLETYAVTYNGNDNTGGAAPGSQTKTEGVDLTLATNSGSLARTGYTFICWNTADDGSGTDYAEGATYNVDAALALYAKWIINTYTVTFVEGDNGSRTSGATLVQTIDYGSAATAPTMTPNAGYTFDGWDVAFDNVTSDLTVTAQYTIITYTLTYNAGANGSITGTTPQTIDHGSDGAAVTAVPNANYHFVDWSDALTDNPRTDPNVTADVTVTANFAEDPQYTLTVESGTGDGTYYAAAVQSITADSPPANQEFDCWTGDTANVANIYAASTTITMPAANTTVTATFCSTRSDFTYTDNGSDITITGYTGSGGAIIIPSTILEKPVVEIGVQAFHSCASITSAVIPGSVTSIEQEAFFASGLTSVTIPDNVTDIGASAFKNCTSLVSVDISDSITTIGLYAFTGCGSLTSISVAEANTTYSSEDGVLFNEAKTQLIQYPIANARSSYSIPDGVTNIYNQSFTDCNNLSSVTMPDSVTSISYAAFKNCGGLISLTLSNNLTSIYQSAFENCSGLTSLTIPASVSTIWGFAFRGCSGLTSVTIPSGIPSITDSVFYGCSALTSVSIPETVNTIQASAFSYCSSLTSVTIPASVTNIGNYAFRFCDNLASAVFSGNAPSTFGSLVFHSSAPGFTIFYHAGATGFSTPTWNGYPCYQSTHTLTYAAGANGSITGDSPQTINHASDGTAVTAVPAANYHFVDWSDASTENPRTDTNVMADITLTANFAINTYTVSFVEGDNGSRTGGGALVQTIDHASAATAPTITPNAGYTFDGWDVAFDNVTSNLLVTAQYTIITYTVTFLTDGTGGATLDGTLSQNINHGADCTAVTANVPANYSLSGWTGGVTSGDNPLTVTNVTSDLTITANFAIDTYTLTYTAGANGSITGTTPQTIDHGSDGTAVTAVPATNYHFVDWSDASTENPRTDANVMADVTVTANFALSMFVDSGQSLAALSSWDVKVADLDGDGDLDAFVANGGPNKVWKNNGSGVFSDSGQALGSALSKGVDLGDLDGDGDIDAYIANGMGFPDKILLNDGTGAFTDSGQELGTSYSNGVALGDLDGDGDLDAFTVSLGGDNINKVWLNNGSGTFTDSGQALGDWTSFGVTLADIDNDGDLDALEASLNGGIWINNGSGVFSLNGQKLGEKCAGVGDLDGDGDLDAVFSQNMKIHLNNGLGVFSNNGQGTLGFSGNGVAIGDLDGDGDIDAFFTRGYDVTTMPNQVWLNDGDAAFSNIGEALGDSSTQSVALGDFDDDGDLDVFVANMSMQPNKVWLNQSGSGTAILTLASLPADAGTTSPANGSHNYSLGAEIQNITATPNANYTFSGWTGDYNGTDNPLSVTPLTPTFNLTANFTLNTYTVTFVEGANGSRTDGGALIQTIDHGSAAEAPTITANIGFDFDGWDVAFDNVTSDLTVTAQYSVSQYTVSFRTDGTPDASFTGSADQIVSHGSNCTAVTASAPGHTFSGWTGGVTSSDNPLLVTNVTSDLTITANFTINTYTLTYTAGANGSIDGASPQTVDYGSSGTTITAVPDANYHFVDWSDALTSNPRTDGNVMANISLTANFAINTYTVTFSEGDNGSRTGGGALVQTIAHGSAAEAPIITPNFGYSFDGWSSSLFENVTQDLTISASYSIATYTVTFLTDGTAGATIAGTNPQTVSHGASNTAVLATPPASHTFDGWTGDVTSSDNPLTVTNITSDMTITANFAIKTYTVTYNGNGYTGGTAPGDQTKTYGVNLTLATNSGTLVKDGSTFEGWNTASDGSGTDYAEGATYTGNADLDLYAKWTLLPPTVVATKLFYNNSAWDGDTGASVNDDSAIATDKTALLAADGAATFANYSSYGKGLNGIMIDIQNVLGTPTAADFTFKVGNDNAPAGWSAAPAPVSVSTRSIGGAVTRVTIIWADNAIEKTWLEVTVLVTPETGLGSPHTFYFGNAVGDCGDSASDAMVNASDQLGARNNTTTPGTALITDVYDYNRDKTVGADDILKARNNSTSPVTMLNLINP